MSHEGQCRSSQTQASDWRGDSDSDEYICCEVSAASNIDELRSGRETHAEMRSFHQDIDSSKMSHTKRTSHVLASLAGGAADDAGIHVARGPCLHEINPSFEGQTSDLPGVAERDVPDLI